MNNLNMISHVYTPEEMESLINDIKVMKAKFTAIIGQSAADKKSLINIEGSNKTFVEDCYKLMVSNPEYLPVHIKVDEVAKDIHYHAQLDEFMFELNELQEKMRGTQMRVGHEAYKASLEYYNSVNRAADNSVAGAIAISQQMKTRFAKQGNRNSKKADNTGTDNN